MTREIILGVDFGTSYTSAGAIIDGKVELVVDSGDSMIPSVVHIPERGPPLVGRMAVAQLAAQPGATVTSVKRLMGSDLGESGAMKRLAPSLPYRIAPSASGSVVLKLRNQDWAVEQIAAAVLDRVRGLAEQRFGARVHKVVVTAATMASARYHASLYKAARLAHLEVLEVIAEPIAGALALGLHARPETRRTVVCDFGGGTFDVTAMLQAGLKFQAIAVGGDPFLGGDDLDEAMVQAVAGSVYKRARFDMMRDAVRRQLLLLRCESAKRSLSSANDTRLVMREAYVEDGRSHDISVMLERRWAEALWEPLFARAMVAVDDTLRRAGWADEDVHQVAVIGGTSLVPRFQELIRARFGAVEVTATDTANVAVAMGATLLTARHGATTRRDIPVLQDADLDQAG